MILNLNPKYDKNHTLSFACNLYFVICNFLSITKYEKKNFKEMKKEKGRKKKEEKRRKKEEGNMVRVNGTCNGFDRIRTPDPDDLKVNVLTQ